MPISLRERKNREKNISAKVEKSRQLRVHLFNLLRSPPLPRSRLPFRPSILFTYYVRLYTTRESNRHCGALPIASLKGKQYLHVHKRRQLRRRYHPRTKRTLCTYARYIRSPDSLLKSHPYTITMFALNINNFLLWSRRSLSNIFITRYESSFHQTFTFPLPETQLQPIFDERLIVCDALDQFFLQNLPII